MAGEAEIERMVVRLLGDASSYEKMLRRAETATQRTVKNMGRSITRVGDSVAAFGMKLIKLVTLPLAAIGVGSVVAFASFDKAMVESTSIMSVTETQIESLRDTALSLSASGNLLQGPTELAQAYFFLASAGKNAGQSMALLPKVARFATAGAFNMSLATDLLTDAQSALGMSSQNVIIDTKNLVTISDALVGANTLANASVQQFATALTTKAGSAIKAYNIDLNQGIALLAAYADQGIKAELAGNALDRMLRLMAKSSIENREEFERLGITVFDDTGHFRDFKDIIGDLEKALGHLSPEMRITELAALGFEARIQGVILPLIGTSEAIEEYVERLKEMAGITNEVAEKQMQAFSNKLTVLKNQIKVVAIDIGGKLVPDVEKLVGVLGNATKWWSRMSDTMKGQIVTIAKYAAGIPILVFVLGKLLSVVGMLVIAIGTNFVGALGAAAIAAANLTLSIATLTFAMFALHGVAILLGGVVIFAAVAPFVMELIDAFEELNKELALSAELSAKVQSRIIRTTFQTIQEGQQLPTEKAREFLTNAVEMAKKNAEQGAVDNVKNIRKELEKVDTLWGNIVSRGTIKMLKQDLLNAENVLKSSTTSVELLQEALSKLPAAVDLDALKKALADDAAKKLTGDVKTLTESLEKQLRTFGMTPREAAISDLEFMGATPEELFDAKEIDRQLSSWEKFRKDQAKIDDDANRALAAAEQVRASVLSPMERLEEEQMALEKLRGRLDPNTFNRAMAKLAVDFEKEQQIGKQQQRSAPSLGIQAAQHGSAESQARIMAFRSTGPDATAAETTADEVTLIRQILERVENGETATDIIKPAGLRI